MKKYKLVLSIKAESPALKQARKEYPIIDPMIETVIDESESLNDILELYNSLSYGFNRKAEKIKKEDLAKKERRKYL